MANPATVADLEARWRPLSDNEFANAEAFLEDAWALLLGRRPSLEDDLEGGSVQRANVIRVVCAMVLRVLRNPEGKITEQIDDYKYTRSEDFASGVMFVTPEELADITAPSKRGQRSVRLVAYGEF